MPRKPISHELRFSIVQRDNFTCFYCGRRPPEVTLHLDHFEPQSAGGSNDPDNLVTACAECNIGKRAKPVVPTHYRMIFRGLFQWAAIADRLEMPIDGAFEIFLESHNKNPRTTWRDVVRDMGDALSGWIEVRREKNAHGPGPLQ
jgi:HNH endonuclease